MRRGLRWTVTVLVLLGAGGLLGGYFGTLMYRFSYDYVVVPSEYADLGLRLGFVVGTVLAAAQVVGRRPLPGWGTLAAAVVLVGAVTCLAVLVGKEAGALLFDRGIFDTAGWRLPNARRHAEVMGIDAALVSGPLLGGAVGAWLLWRARLRPPAPGTSSPDSTTDPWT